MLRADVLAASGNDCPNDPLAAQLFWSALKNSRAELTQSLSA